MPIQNEMMDVSVILKETQKQPNNTYLFTYNGVPTPSATKTVTVRLAWDQSTFTNIVNALVISEIENINIVSAHVDDLSAYYVPALVEIRVGYEFERYTPTSEQRYETVVFDINDMENIENLVQEAGEGKIRVAYLKRSSVETAGWIYDSTTNDILKFTKATWIGDPSAYYGATVTSMELFFNPTNQEVKIDYYITGGQSFRMFYGHCKSYNELITVMYLTKAI